MGTSHSEPGNRGAVYPNSCLEQLGVYDDRYGEDEADPERAREHSVAVAGVVGMPCLIAAVMAR